MPTSLHHHRINKPNSSSTTTASTYSQKQPPPPQTTSTCPLPLPNDAVLYHTHPVGPNQCSSAVVQPIAAPVSKIWPVLRRFDDPCAYKHFLKSCRLVSGDGAAVGSLREVRVVSGLPAASSTERLDVLDDDRHLVGFSIVGGVHRLTNYRSVTSLHRPSDGSRGTVVVESYVVDVPPGNTVEETCVFVDTIVRCNLQSLAKLTENFGPK